MATIFFIVISLFQFWISFDGDIMAMDKGRTEFIGILIIHVLLSVVAGQLVAGLIVGLYFTMKAIWTVIMCIVAVISFFSLLLGKRDEDTQWTVK